MPANLFSGMFNGIPSCDGVPFFQSPLSRMIQKYAFKVQICFFLFREIEKDKNKIINFEIPSRYCRSRYEL